MAEFMSKEPVFHSEFDDELPESHPLAWKMVVCVGCRQMVHASNNECMQAWFETGIGAVCFPCFFRSFEISFSGYPEGAQLPETAPDWELFGFKEADRG